MPIEHVTVSFPTVSGLAEDVVVNSFTFVRAGNDDETERSQIAWGIQAFYSAVGTVDAHTLGHYMSSKLDRNAYPVLRFYDILGHLNGSPHGSPVFETDISLAAANGGAANLPDEVAMCLTLRGENYLEEPVEIPDTGDAGTEPDRPRQRVTGRVYIGPLNISAITPDANARPTTAFRNRCLEAGLFLTAAFEEVDVQWCVWSRKAAMVTPLESVQVDDAWDTMRSRGVRPTSRTTQATPQFTF